MKTLQTLIAMGTLPLLLASPVAWSTEFDDDHHDFPLSEIECDRENFTGCFNGVSGSVSNSAALRVGTQRVNTATRERGKQQVQTAQVAGQTTGTGLAAGDPASRVFGMWGSYSYNDFDSDFSLLGVPLGYEADQHSGLGGIDRLFHGRYLLGLSFGYSNLDTKTRFNGGGQESDGYTIAPYAAVLLNDIFSVDLSGGYAWLDYDQNRISFVDGTGISSSFDGDRWFIATNLNAIKVVDKFVFGAKIGYLHTSEEQEGYTEVGSAASGAAGALRTIGQRDIKLTQGVVGAEIAYMAGAYEPYFAAEYRNDLSRNDGTRAGGLPAGFGAVQPRDDDEFQLGFGVRYYTDWGVTGTFEYQRVEGRSQFDSDLFMFTLRASL